MRRNRKSDSKKERTIMIASSAFVLAALTMTGIYMKSSNADEQDDGYMIDFTELENNVSDKYQEIVQNNQEDSLGQPESDLGVGDGIENAVYPEVGHPQDDLDYLPMEAGSGLVTIPGLTDGQKVIGQTITGQTATGQTITGQSEENVSDENDKKDTAGEGNKEWETPAADAVATQDDTSSAESEVSSQEDESANGNEVISQTLNFTESDGLLRPVSGEVLIPFSMEGSVYFSTLDQFKYNPALMIAAEKGSAVIASARGKVVDIFQNEEIGYAVTMELGNGYRITYGQLDNINVTLDSYVEPGEIIATVAAPTKYYSVEGSNLYVKVTENGSPVNPERLFR